MQEEDAARRLAILRGEIPPPLEEPHPDETLPPPPPAPHGRDRDTPGRKRKRHGEDDTDFEMRIARERTTAARELTTHTTPTITTSSSAPLLDSKGHLTLFPEPDAHTARSREGHPDAEREAARKERELKDQYQMRLVNAAGRDGAGLTDGGPWYASSAVSAVEAGVGEGGGAALGAPVVPSKNVFGREDPGRGARAAARLDASDPLAVMRRGARMVRELERERRKEVGERERELRALEKEERRRERRRRREGDDRSRRRERHRSSDRDGGSGSGERRSRHHDNEPRERDKHRSEERERRGRDREGSPHRRERSRRNYEERTRDRSRERDVRREDGHKDFRHRDEEKDRRSHKPNDDR